MQPSATFPHPWFIDVPAGARESLGDRARQAIVGHREAIEEVTAVHPERRDLMLPSEEHLKQTIAVAMTLAAALPPGRVAARLSGCV
jgi:hypothetical protein